MVSLALLVPLLSLVPLGSLWLWERGYLLYWIGAAFVVTIVTLLIELTLLPSPRSSQQEPVDHHLSMNPADAADPVREAAAWDAVEALVAAADPTKFVTRDAFIDLGVQTIEAVARSMHPLDKDPLWRFTVPEALALVEHVSRELRPFVVDNIPLGDQLTVGQVMKIYQWRNVFGVAEHAYDVWRIVRLLNPATAVASEAREQLTKKLYSGLRNELGHRLIGGYVREVGRAAIALYSGRMHSSALPPAEPAPPASKVKRSWTWKKLWSQTKGAGGTATRIVSRGKRKPPK